MRKLSKYPFCWLLAIFLIGETGVRLVNDDVTDGNYEFGLCPEEGMREVDGVLQLNWTHQRRFRQQRMPMGKTEGRKRIFVFGDSVARASAAQVPYAARIGESLREMGVDVEVVNFAAIGVGCRKVRAIMESALKYNPDLVVIHINAHNEAFDERDWKLRQQFLNWHPRFWLAHSQLFRSVGDWKRVQLYDRLIPGIAGPMVQENEKFVLHEQWQAGVYSNRVARVRRVVAENVAIARASGAKILLVSPVRVVAQDGMLQFDDEGFDEYCRSRRGGGVEFVSMTEVFQSVSPVDTFLQGDGVHLDSPGHAQLGRALADHIVEAKLLD